MEQRAVRLHDGLESGPTAGAYDDTDTTHTLLPLGATGQEGDGRVAYGAGPPID